MSECGPSVCACLCAGGGGSGWMVNGISDGFDFYFNVDTMQQSWQLPESDELDPSLLTHADIQVPCSYLSIWLITGLHIHTHARLMALCVGLPM